MPWVTLAWQWVLRLLGGWIPLGNKPIGEWLGKILWAVGIFAACFFVMTRFHGCKKVIPTPPAPEQQTSNGGDIYKIEPHFGCVTMNGKGIK